MNDISTLLLTQFFNDIDILIMIIVRVLAFFIVIPILSGTSIPNMIKIMLSAAIAIMLFSTGRVTQIAYYNSVMGYVVLVVEEFLVGFTMGFVVYMIFSVVYFAGQLIDYQIGFSMVSVYDPMTQIQVPIMGNMLYFITAVLLVLSGGLHSFIAALSYSYDAIPIGTQVILGNEQLLMYIISLLGDFFLVGLRMALPVVGSLLIIDVALGVLVKAVPQMNVFVVGIPIKMLVGLLIIYLIMPAFISMFNEIFEMSYKAVDNVIGGMSP